jgi:hypothetical protein
MEKNTFNAVTLFFTIISLAIGAWQNSKLKNLPESLFIVELNDVPVGEPLVAQELGHVVPHRVRKNDDAFLAGLEGRGRLDRDADGRTAAAAAKHALVADETPENRRREVISSTGHITNPLFRQATGFYAWPTNANFMVTRGNTKGGSITVPLTSCLTGLD